MSDLLSAAEPIASLSPRAPERVTFVLDSLSGGGVQRAWLSLAAVFLESCDRVDFAVCEPGGAFASRVPSGVRVFPLEPTPRMVTRLMALRADPRGLLAMLRPILLAGSPPGYLRYLHSFARYLTRERPSSVITGGRTLNIMAVWARELAGVDTRVLVSEHVSASQDLEKKRSREWRRRYLPPVMRRAYAAADAIVAVSDGVALDLAALTGLPRSSITTIYNPVIDARVLREAGEPVEHPWLRAGQPPVVLGAGRLIEQKDFPLLVRAFAAVRRRRRARLLILGAASDEAKTAARRAELMALAAELGVAEDVEVPGFAANLPAHLSRAAVFVLSSRWEGFANVLAEALACGCPVVSTDCPSGPAEVLGGGRFGRLVPLGNVDSMAEAIVATLDAPPDRAALRSRGLWFGVERAAEAYLRLITAPPREAGVVPIRAHRVHAREPARSAPTSTWRPAADPRWRL